MLSSRNPRFLQAILRQSSAAGSAFRLPTSVQSQGVNGYLCGLYTDRRGRSLGIHTSSSCSMSPVPSFGLLLDIDGVVSRGRNILPGVKDAFQQLTDDRGKFRVPTVFVTNAGNIKRAEKAERLSKMLSVNIGEEQVIMSHSPLKMFTQFHERHVLVCGQGQTREIANALGFVNVTTIDDLREAFPGLDCVDHKRRLPETGVFTEPFPNIEAVILFGEPTRWETSLQLIVDVLMTNGCPTMSTKRGDVPYPHIPVLACNIDLLWMSDTASLPRFAHGTFLFCLENVYKKLTSNELQYTAVMGKPSQLTYHHAEWVIKNEATKIGIPAPETIYAVGDNPEADVLGANIFHQYLTQRGVRQVKKRPKPKAAHSVEKTQKAQIGGYTESVSNPTDGMCELTRETDSDSSLENDDDRAHAVSQAEQWLGDHGVEQCYSILVETGVYSSQCQMNGIVANSHLGDFCNSSLLKTPTFVEADLQSAVRMVFEREAYFPPSEN